MRYTETGQRELDEFIIEARGEDRDAALAELMRQPWGRRFVYYLLYELCGIEQSTFNSTSQRLTDFGEGRRAVARDLQNRLQMAEPELYGNMLVEQTEARAELISEWISHKEDNDQGDQYA